MSNSTLLCLACSSSLPTRSNPENLFRTPCCTRPICSNCLASNPRLARYNPCLRCLGGIGVVQAHARAHDKGNYIGGSQGMTKSFPKNVDGGMHDEDTFVLGDEDEDEDTDGSGFEDDSADNTSSTTPSPPPAYSDPINAPTDLQSPQTPSDSSSTQHPDGGKPSDENTSTPTPQKYFIKPRDTLLGISLKYGIDGYLLCRLNSLPPSTLRTTPHILHTRTYLTFPPTPTRTPLPPSSSSAQEQEAEVAERIARRVREKAEKRFQTLTKEVDWRIAKAYVALADPRCGSDTEEDELNSAEGKIEKNKKNEGKLVGGEANTLSVNGETTLEGRAIDRYLDDDEWEDRERREGRGVVIPRFPLFQNSGGSSVGQGEHWMRRSWWSWKDSR